MRIKFIKSPTGEYGLAYFAGEEANLEDEQCKILIEAGMAEAVSSEGEEVKPIKRAVKKK